MSDPLSRFKYSSAYDPPAPVIKLKIANPGTQAITEEDFLVDSGADISLLKNDVFEVLDLQYLGSSRISGVTGLLEEWPVSWISVETPFKTSELIKVVITPQGDENILGRDLLNRWKLLFDGPKQQLSFET